MQNVVDKNNLQDTEVFNEIIFIITATAFNSKNIDTEMDPPASLSVSVTASSPISVYRSIKGLLVNRFWNGKHHCDVFHKPTPSPQ